MTAPAPRNHPAEDADLAIGTPVLAYPGFRPDDPVPSFAASARVLDTVTRSAPWQTGAGDWIVAVEGHAGGIALTHIDIKDPS